MEKSEIIKTFLSLGHQLDAHALDFLFKNQEKISYFLENIKTNEAPPTISLNFLENPSGKKEAKIQQKKAVSDVVTLLSQRYKKLKETFNNRLNLINLISINKITPKTRKFSVVGMVEEKMPYQNSIVLEDETGNIKIHLKTELFNQVIEDEVIGAVCEKTDNGPFCNSIVFPDVPLHKELKKTADDVYCFFVSDIHMESELFNKTAFQKFFNWLNEQEKMNVFIMGDVSSNEKEINWLFEQIPAKHKVFFLKGEIDAETTKNTLPNPARVNFDNVNLFLFHNQKINYYTDLWGAQAIVNLIKKRHLDPCLSLDINTFMDDPYLLDTVPDVVIAAHTHIPTNVIYKNTTILTTGSFVSQPIFWLINLRTRETFKIDFS